MRHGSLQEFFARPAPDVGRDLIGWSFFVDDVGGRIVETEAYTRDDEASHSFRGPTRANAAMFGPPASAYVYRIYGLHLCLNFVCGDAGAVLLRALAPSRGQGAMAVRRGMDREVLLCSGPGRVAQALAIHRGMNGMRLSDAPFHLEPPAQSPPVMTGPRIGLSRARERPWRFGLAGSPHLSKPFPLPASPLRQEGYVHERKD